MHGEAYVSLTAWVAVACWFAGVFVRNRTHSNNAQRQAGYAWLIGAIVISIHIFASYAIVHDWSHTDALRVTADESERVTGIRAGWGVYVNFAFTVIWFSYSLALVCDRPIPVLLDGILFWLTALVVFSATVVFESGLPRFVSLIAFTTIFVVSLRGIARSANHSGRGQ